MQWQPRQRQRAMAAKKKLTALLMIAEMAEARAKAAAMAAMRAVALETTKMRVMVAATEEARATAAKIAAERAITLTVTVAMAVVTAAMMVRTTAVTAVDKAMAAAMAAAIAITMAVMTAAVTLMVTAAAMAVLRLRAMALCVTILVLWYLFYRYLRVFPGTMKVYCTKMQYFVKNGNTHFRDLTGIVKYGHIS
jgi:hypothetical protein